MRTLLEAVLIAGRVAGDVLDLRAVSTRRLATLRAALGFLAVTPAAPELQLLHRWLDSWAGLGLVVTGVERLGLRASLTHVAEGEWRASFAGHPMFAPVGYGVAATPWGAVQVAARAAIRNPRREASL
jgi:hypothetical protein